MTTTVAPLVPAPSEFVAARASAAAGALAGTVAAGVALAVTEFLSVIGSRAGPSLVATVASRMVNLTAGTLKNFAVSVFGHNDKRALLIGIVVVALLVGAVVGMRARRERWIGDGAFIAFGAVGVWCALVDPQASSFALSVASLLGAGAGLAVLRLLLRAASHAPAVTVAAPNKAQDPRLKTTDRRTFIGAASIASVGAVALTAIGRSLRTTGVATKIRAATKLPTAISSTKLPQAQPFTVDGLSSYVTSNADFYRIDTAIFVPQVDASNWKLTIGGMVDHPLSFTYADLLAMEMIEEPITIACVSNEVGGDLVGTAVWRGVRLSTLLERAGVQAGATQLVGRSVDDFTVGFPTEKALDGRVAMVAVGMNGEPLPIDHGFPARLIVAGLYGYVSATKWLRQIDLTRLEDFDAYWIPRGWAKEAPIKTQSRIDLPRTHSTLTSGRIAVAGVAWAPTRGIKNVEVHVDDGPWQQARLGDVASNNTWVQWLYEWNATPGKHRLQVRATDGTGSTQTADIQHPEPDGATGYHTRVVTVA